MAHARIVTSYDLGPEGRVLIATAGDDPAAGAEVSITVPGRAVWRVLAFRAVLVTDATVTNRQVSLLVDNSETVFWQVAAGAVQTASLTVRYSAAPGIAGDAQVAGGVVVLPLPPLTLLPGWRIRTSTVALQAGDDWGAPVLYVQETPQRGVEVGQEALRSALRRLIGEEV